MPSIQDAQHAQRQAQDNKNKRAEELQDIKFLLKTPQGKRFFKRFMKIGKVFETTFTGNSHTYFAEGRRDLALKVFHDILEIDPSAIAILASEKPLKEQQNGR